MGLPRCCSVVGQCPGQLQWVIITPCHKVSKNADPGLDPGFIIAIYTILGRLLSSLNLVPHRIAEAMLDDVKYLT